MAHQSTRFSSDLTGDTECINTEGINVNQHDCHFHLDTSFLCVNRYGGDCHVVGQWTARDFLLPKRLYAWYWVLVNPFDGHFLQVTTFVVGDLTMKV
ncbi:MAG: hypothetical protein KDD84_10435 [Caldilineaceae bacterium]|nr:hypothetical protein [Caldilineaceae bacterium]